MEEGAQSETAQTVEQNDIWSIITREKGGPGAVTCKDATAIFCGGKGSGKSTLIEKFTNPESVKVLKPTAALEYKSARKDMKNGEHKTVHLWELGGGSQLCSLLDRALKKDTFGGTVCLVVVDLSQLDQIVAISRFWFKQFQDRAKQVFNSLQEDARTSNMAQQNGSPECYGLPVYLVAHKCFSLKHAEPLVQKTVAKTLRSLALEMGATLLYTDIERVKENQSIQIFRKKLNHDVFGTEPMQVFITDVSRTLAISVGCDSEDKINGEGVRESWDQRLREVCGEKSIEEIDGKASVLELDQYMKCEAEARQQAVLLGERDHDNNRKKPTAGRRSVE